MDLSLAFGVVALSALVVAAVAGLLQLRTLRTVQRDLLRFLRVPSLAKVHLITGEKVSRILHVDLARSLPTFLAAEGLPFEVRGTDGLMAPAGCGSNEVVFKNMLAGGFIGPFGTASHSSFRVGHDRTEVVPTCVTYLVRGPAGPFLVRAIDPAMYAEEVGYEAAIGAGPSADAWLDDLVQRLDAFAIEHSILKGQALIPGFTGIATLKDVDFLAVDEGPTPRVDEDVARQVEESFIYYVEQHERLTELGIRAHRGLFLCGEPGTGKTTTCRWLRQRLPGHTFLLAAAAQTDNIQALFRLARHLAPTVVVLEDVDLVMAPRDQAPGGNGRLEDLLNALDGLQPRHRVSVVLTSNSWKFVDRALADRPGRVDHVIRFGLPKPAHREALLRQFAGPLTLTVPVEDLAAQSEGMTPAQLREWVDRAVVRRLRRGPGEDVSREDFTSCLPDAKSQFARLVETPRIGMLSRFDDAAG